MAAQHDIQLRWAVIEDQLREISDFAHLAPSKRPAASCPICNRDVTMKLGEIRAYHIAHQPSDVLCVATNPETALHLNMKFYIAKQLRRANKLFAEEQCRNCNNTRLQVLFSDWDDVQVEHAVGIFRPDVLLLANGHPAGAIEVLVTHKVDEKKAKYYELHDVRWIEVVGNVSFYEGATAWTADKPIPIHRNHPDNQGWKCPDCLEREEEEKAAQERRRQQPEHKKATSFAPR
ncbi:MAG: competence protein CoiA [Anaerolineae bacterium]|nr:competence protein CoiA [Anaerolineae bacterium]